MGRSALCNSMLKSQNQLLVELFMAKCNSPLQSLPVYPTMCSLDERKLRARLMLEETLETIREGLGLDVQIKDMSKTTIDTTKDVIFNDSEINKPCLTRVADGCADVEVVTLGTAAACGIAAQPIFTKIAANNLLKFAPGHTFDKGKLIKPPDHPNPTGEIIRELAAQHWNPTEADSKLMAEALS